MMGWCSVQKSITEEAVERRGEGWNLGVVNVSGFKS